MNGNRGKLVAQAGHAYLHSYWDAVSLSGGYSTIFSLKRVKHSTIEIASEFTKSHF